MMIDEAIDFCKEKSKNIKLKTEPQTFVMIADMLEKLKAIENGFTDDLLNMGFTKGYSKAINDYNEALHEEIGKYQFPVEKIDEIADRLKRWWDNAK